MRLEQKNLSGEKLPEGVDFAEWLEKGMKVIRKAGLADRYEEKLANGLLELCFVDGEEMRKLNKEFRGKDSETDVLSFAFLEGENFPGDNLVGQIFIEPLIAKKQAAEHGLSWAEEQEFLFVHGLLHIFGMDHEQAEDFEKMFRLHAEIMPDQKWGNFVEKIYQEYFGRD